MKLRTRFEHFLAKIAGRDVDIEALTPANAIEELMLEIAGKQLPIDVLVTVSYNDDGQYTINKSFNEIQAAKDDGKRIGAIFCQFGFCQFIPVYETDYGYEFTVSLLQPGDNRISVSATTIRLASDNTITDWYENITIR